MYSLGQGGTQDRAEQQILMECDTNVHQSPCLQGLGLVSSLELKERTLSPLFILSIWDSASHRLVQLTLPRKQTHTPIILTS